MAALEVTGKELHLKLTLGEKLAGLSRDIRVPVASVRDVRVEPDVLAAVRGLRAPGLSIPGRTKIGTWRRRGSRGFVVARAGVPGVRVTLNGPGPDELIVSTPTAESVAERLRADANLAGRPGSRADLG